ncbi:unnamed protein product [Fraxinus pennsylvanica]|uniref:RNase H type-1 domain-containing protein n=1 Tax=Fraxinus pennsylvanica TaxID=56036 RepID=A0AAD2ECZ9_9LAMI|nr:unnamed protein product [Fraxinus pennsylvanica]
MERCRYSCSSQLGGEARSRSPFPSRNQINCEGNGKSYSRNHIDAVLTDVGGNKWKAPPADFLKLNVDGATFHHLHKAGVGVVLRDQTGTVLMAASKGEREVADPEMIEFPAVLQGLQLVMSMGISRLVIESDCLFVVSQLNDEESISLSPWSSIIADIRCLLSVFLDVKICHVNRLGNGVAHELARHAWEVESIQMWWEGFPDFISHAIWLDSRL